VTEKDQELNLRQRLSGLSRLPLLRGVRVNGESERLERQLERLQADTSDEAIWRSVELARHADRPYTLDYVARLLDDWVELHGDRGRADAAAMCHLAADGLGVADHEVLVCSTGLIGIPLPMDPIEAGIPRLVAARAGSDAAGADAAQGILTTDSGRKEVLVAHPTFSVAGMAKGAGMLAPDMATMLAFLTTDAAVEPGPLAGLLRAAVADSFNSMSVDGCTSTNDTVILMASGRAGPCDPNVVATAVTEACADLAMPRIHERRVTVAIHRRPAGRGR